MQNYESDYAVLRLTFEPNTYKITNKKIHILC
jgi:hypothetical protein